MKTHWLYYQHPETRQIARVHVADKGKVDLYLRWDWVEIDAPFRASPPLKDQNGSYIVSARHFGTGMDSFKGEGGGDR